MWWKKKKHIVVEETLSQEKTLKRIEQEKQVEIWKVKLDKVSIPKLETKLYALEEKMNRYSFMEFDSDIQEINNSIQELPDKERVLFNYEMGYKFSKSKKEFADYFSEGRFKDYPEMSYVETKNRVGLSFTLNTECLLYCAIYGDQLTQIPLNIEHPYYSKLENANIKYRGMVFDEYFSNVLLTGRNISLKDPYVLKDIIEKSTNQAISAFVQPLRFVKNSSENLGQMYKKIGFDETADFYFDIKKMVDNGNIGKVKETLDEMLPDKGENVLDIYYKNYMEHCKNDRTCIK